MKIEEFQSILKAQPFRPFALCLTDGERVHVDHPDFVARSRSGRTIIVYGDDDSFDVIDLGLVHQVRGGQERPAPE